MMKRTHSRFAAATLAAILAISVGSSALAQNAASPEASPVSTTQVPQPDTGVNWPGVGYGAGALFGNLLYVPAKLTYAILGGLIGGGTYLVTAGNMQAASTVWRSSLGGDYVLTPQMVAGEQPINFSGPTETPPIAPPTTSNATSSGAVQPIAPLPPANSASPGAAVSPAASTANGTHPMDSGSGPVHSKAQSNLPNTSIE